MTIEAVNSVLSNAPYTKAVVEQQSVARSYATNPTRVQEAPQVAPYISLYIKVDVDFDRAILQMRDGDTGDVVRQIPSETQMEAYRRAQEVVAPKIQNLPSDTVDVKEAAPQTSAPVVSTPTPQPQAAPSPQIQTAVVAAPPPQPQTTSVSVSA